jgi:hypothetical protein
LIKILDPEMGESQRNDGQSRDKQFPPRNRAVDPQNGFDGQQIDEDKQHHQPHRGGEAGQGEDPAGRHDEPRQKIIGVGDDGDGFHRRHRDIGQKIDPAHHLGGEPAMAEHREDDDGTWAGEHGGEFRIHEGQQQHRQAPNDPGDQRGRAGNFGRIQRPEQPARADHPAERGEEQPDFPRIPPQPACRQGNLPVQYQFDVRGFAPTSAFT